MTKNSAFERHMLLSVNTVLRERQLSWTERWSLMGDFVICSQCLEEQPIDVANEPFMHLPGCVAIHYALYPWRELGKILNQLPPSSN